MGAKIVVGNTELGIEAKFKKSDFPILVATTHVPQLTRIEAHAERGLVVGASVTWTRLEEAMRAQIEAQPAHRTRTLRAICEQLQWFAGHQIRNVACIGGNARGCMFRIGGGARIKGHPSP